MPTPETRAGEIADIHLALKVAHALYLAERGLGLPKSDHLQLNARLNHILYAAADNPIAIDPGTFWMAYILSEQDRSNVSHLHEGAN